MKVLIADDQISTHQYLEAVLDWEALGFNKVYHTYNGQETLDLLASKKPEILILDIEMPKMNGINVMKKIENIYQPKTIIISAFDEFDYARDALELGVHNYILKPIDPDQLNRELISLITDIKKDIERKLRITITQIINYGVDNEALLQIKNCFFQLGIQYFRVIYFRFFEKEYDKLLSNFRQNLSRVVIPYGSQELIIIQMITNPLSNGDIREFNQSLNIIQKERVVFQGGSSPVESSAKYLDRMIKQSIHTSKLGFYEANKLHVFSYNDFENHFDELLANNILKEIIRGLKLGVIDEHVKVDMIALFDLSTQKLVDPINLYDFTFKLINSMEQVSPKVVHELQINYSSESLQKEFRTVEELQTFLLKIIDEIISMQKADANDQIKLLERVKNYIDSNYFEDVSLQKISKMFYIDKYQLSKLYKEHFSLNYWSYVTKVRMEKSSELLLNTDLKVHQVAIKVGYLDDSHFSQVFKKYYGISPGKYAKAKRNE